MADVTKKVSVAELRKSEDVKPIKKTPVHYPFWFGGSASCFATFFTHPLDLVKVASSAVACANSYILTRSGPVTNTSDIWRTIKHDANVWSCHKD
jgi:hypothetical protein